MRLLFLHGPPAVGKLTVAKALADITGFKLFHNHLIVDALTPVFPFGSEAFIELRERLWLDVFAEAAAADVSLIFTWTPDRTVRPTFIAEVQRTVPTVHFVALTSPGEVLEQRVEDTSRAEFGKLNDVAWYRKLAREGAFDYGAPIPDSGLTLDTSVVAPDEAARRIVEHFGL